MNFASESNSGPKMLKFGCHVDSILCSCLPRLIASLFPVQNLHCDSCPFSFPNGPGTETPVEQYPGVLAPERKASGFCSRELTIQGDRQSVCLSRCSLCLLISDCACLLPAVAAGINRFPSLSFTRIPYYKKSSSLRRCAEHLASGRRALDSNTSRMVPTPA